MLRTRGSLGAVEGEVSVEARVSTVWSRVSGFGYPCCEQVAVRVSATEGF